jgi:hypothetical protein
MPSSLATLILSTLIMEAVATSVVPNSASLVALIIEAIHSSETSALNKSYAV